MLAVAQQYVDLGLPSGTQWKKTNEAGFYTFNQALAKFGTELPTQTQLQELVNYCEWTWTGRGYNIVGPNGQSIYLPAAGEGEINGGVNSIGEYGYYWSCKRWDANNAWYMSFGSGGNAVDHYDSSLLFSIRLIR